MNAPVTLQSALEIIVNNYMWKSSLAYLDDILIFRKPWPTSQRYWGRPGHTPHRRRDIELKKCHWFAAKVEYFAKISRHINSALQRLITKHPKDVKHPRTLAKLRSFFVICNVYWCFVPSYSCIAAPLNQLLGKGQLTKLPLLNADQIDVFKTQVMAAIPPQFCHFHARVCYTQWRLTHVITSSKAALLYVQSTEKENLLGSSLEHYSPWRLSTPFPKKMFDQCLDSQNPVSIFWRWALYCAFGSSCTTMSHGNYGDI